MNRDFTIFSFLAKENIFAVDYAPSDTGKIASETQRNDVFCSMEYGETVSRDQNRNDEPADDIEEKKSSLKNSKEKTHVKAISGKRKDQKSTSFLWTRYLAVRNFKLQQNFMVPKSDEVRACILNCEF